MNSINFTLEPDSKIRLYHQLYDKIIELIQNGSYKPNSKLPSIRTVSIKLGISKNTVTKAYEQLEKNQFVYSEQKRGYFVRDISQFITNSEEQIQEEEEETSIPTVDAIIKQRYKDIEEIQPPAYQPTTDNTQKQDAAPVPPVMQQELNPINQYIQSPRPPKISLEQKFVECFKEIVSQDLSGYEDSLQTFGHQKIRKSIADFLSAKLGTKIDEQQIIISASQDLLLSSILQLQSLNTPYIKSNGMGLLKLANQFTSGSLTTVKAVSAIAEDTDSNTRKLFSNANLPVTLLPTNELGISSDFLITSGATSAFIIPSATPDFCVREPEERRKIILDWANQTSYRYIIEYDSESFFEDQSIIRFKSCDTEDKVIYINSFENLLPFHLKTAFAVLPKNIFADFQQHFDNFSCTVSLLEQLVLSDFIDKGYLNDYLLGS